MSMPNIPNITPIIDLDREKVVNMIMASIAMEEIGLSHIINAEGEKIQYILNSEKYRCVSIEEINEVNRGVDKVLRDVMKMQIFLQEKLENILSIIPKTSNGPKPPCGEAEKSSCKLDYSLTGCGRGEVINCKDPFYLGVFIIDSNIKRIHKDAIDLSLKYVLRQQKENCINSALFLAIPESVKISDMKSFMPCATRSSVRSILSLLFGIMAASKNLGCYFLLPPMLDLIMTAE